MRHESGAEARLRLQRAAVVFWDFDGVIKDSVAVKSDCFEQLFLPYGEQVARRVRQHHEAHGGMSRYEKIPVYLEWAGVAVTEANIADFCARFAAMVLQSVIDSPWVPGVREYLYEHHARQCFVLTTATPLEEIQQILQTLDLTRCFHSVHGAPAKKAVAIRTELASRAEPVAEALAVGDSESDWQAAQANGVAFLLRRTPLNRTLQERYSGPAFDDLL